MEKAKYRLCKKGKDLKLYKDRKALEWLFFLL